jgi:hypothetical protein
MMVRFSHWLVFSALLLIFPACGVNPAAHAPGELGRRFAETVPGKPWSHEGSAGGVEGRMIKQFNKDGSAKGVLLFKKRTGSVSVVMPEIPFTSRWRVVGDVVETYDVKTGVPGLFKQGEVIRDTILSVSPDRILSRSNDTGKTEVLERLGSD